MSESTLDGHHVVLAGFDVMRFLDRDLVGCESIKVLVEFEGTPLAKSSQAKSSSCVLTKVYTYP